MCVFVSEREKVCLCAVETQRPFRRRYNCPSLWCLWLFQTPFVFLSFPSPYFCPRCCSEKRPEYNDAQFTALPGSLSYTHTHANPHYWHTLITPLDLVPSTFPFLALFLQFSYLKNSSAHVYSWMSLSFVRRKHLNFQKCSVWRDSSGRIKYLWWRFSPFHYCSVWFCELDHFKDLTHLFMNLASLRWTRRTVEYVKIV